MAKKKRKDKNKIIKTGVKNLPEIFDQTSSGGLYKSILILTEGETEENYFCGLKSNTILKEKLASIDIKKVNGDLVSMLWVAMENEKNYEKIWLVFDNDKRNSFILSENLFEKIFPEKLPQSILSKLNTAYQEKYHKYFLSTNDYLKWISSVLGTGDAIKYWDIIRKNTPKNWDFEKYQKSNPYLLFLESELFRNTNSNSCIYKNINTNKAKQFDSRWKEYTEKAYTCLSFEFWLILHFEQIANKFIWVEKYEDSNIDVFEYFKENWCLNYKKGNSFLTVNDSKCTAYMSLFENHEAEIPTLKDEQKAINRIIKAYCNSLWLKAQMQVELTQQNGNWYEVNPYVDGLETLIAEILKIKHLKTEIKYFESIIIFDFDDNTLTLSIRDNSQTQNIINDNHKDCFRIVSFSNNEYYPINIGTKLLPNDGSQIDIDLIYDIPTNEQSNIVLFFNDFRSKSKSIELIVLLSDEF